MKNLNFLSLNKKKYYISKYFKMFLIFFIFFIIGFFIDHHNQNKKNDNFYISELKMLPPSSILSGNLFNDKEFRLSLYYFLKQSHVIKKINQTCDVLNSSQIIESNYMDNNLNLILFKLVANKKVKDGCLNKIYKNFILVHFDDFLNLHMNRIKSLNKFIIDSDSRLSLELLASADRAAYNIPKIIVYTENKTLNDEEFDIKKNISISFIFAFLFSLLIVSLLKEDKNKKK
jgi:hypothetical protein